MATDQRFGIGVDIHPREEGRELWLGGVRFDGDAGLAGHSDGDVVCHAVADALLGAAALGDVGMRFPEGDPSIAGIAGGELLSRTVALLRNAGHAPVSCDLTVLAERPEVAPRREEMRASIAGVLGISNERVSVKATRPEGLGLTGDGVGCVALAVIT